MDINAERHATKSQKSRITALQFDQGLMEQINHACSMNVPVNAVSSAVMFAMLLRKRLYGDVKAGAACAATVAQLIDDAKVERAQEHLRQDEERRRAEMRIITPGDPRFNPRG